MEIGRRPTEIVVAWRRSARGAGEEEGDEEQAEESCEEGAFAGDLPSGVGVVVHRWRSKGEGRRDGAQAGAWIRA